MNKQQKTKIANAILAKKDALDMSDGDLANSIGVSRSMVNHLSSGRWETEEKYMLSDEAFRKFAAWLGIVEDWHINKDDPNFRKIQDFCHDAKSESESFAISAAPGFCKSEAAMDFANNNKNT
jgi:ribosome-binding protein aMBF1 (putative translation factor)